MTSLSHSVPAPMRSPWSFMGSLCLHAWVLAWVALAPAISLERAKSLYQREIQPSEKHIVWYKLSDRLPDVSQPETRRDARPLRARTRFNQNLVAGPRDNARPPQLILAPAPEINLSRPLPLPNIVAVSPVRPPAFPFIAPPIKPRAPSPAPSLPEAPKFAAAALDVKAPAVDSMAEPPVRRFTPPKQPKLSLPADPSPLPAAPELLSSNPNMTVPAALLSRQHTFVAPARQPAAPGEPATIEALPPTIAASTAMLSEDSLVIAGLDPAKSVEVPAPPGSVKAGFSGGPKPQPKGAEGTPSGGLLEIPSLTIQGGATNPKLPVMVARVSPTSPEGLAAALRAARGMTPPSAGSAHPAVKVSSAPDPRMYGRQVYTMALQIPNLTSYSGSWLVWFASHEPDIGNPGVDLRPPLPLHMVSPKYIRSAVEDRVEGKVRLWAVIAKDGHVGDISLLQHLDDRLDHSAEEALGKWLFEPAVRNGVVVDVDAVFEIPFNLAPKNDR
jgi:TonB family protein